MFGLAARKSLGELDRPADLAVIVIRPDLILDAVREAAASGHRHLLILPGGFAEAGPPGIARNQALLALAAQRGLTVAGPNCAGIVHLDPHWRFALLDSCGSVPLSGLSVVLRIPRSRWWAKQDLNL